MLKSDRTQFYTLPLQGVNTGEVESVDSYVQRLAFAHQMKVNGIISAVFPELSAREAAFNYGILFEVGSSLATTGQRRERFTSRLSEACGVDVRDGTPLKYSGVLSSIGLMHSRERLFCPLCVRENDDFRLGYGRLAWDFKCTCVCLRHKVRLRSRTCCGGPSTSHLPLHSRPKFPTVCPKCGSIGYECVAEPAVQASRQEIWIAEQVASLVTVPQSHVERDISQDSLSEGILAIAREVNFGRLAQTSEGAGLSRGQLSVWVGQKLLPTLPGLLRLCLYANCNVVDLLRGRFVRSETPRGTLNHHGFMKRARRVVPVDRDLLRRHVCEGIADGARQTFAKLCADFGVSERAVRQYLPEEVAEFARVRALTVAKEADQRRDDEANAYLAAGRSLLAGGMTLSRRNLQAEVKSFPHSSSRHWRTAYQDVQRALGG